MASLRFNFFIWASLLLSALSAGHASAKSCSQIFESRSSGFEISRYQEHYTSFTEAKQRESRWYEQQMVRLQRGELKSLSEAMALSDAVAGTSYFGTMAERFGGLEIREPVLLPHLKLQGRFPFVQIRRHKDIGSGRLRRGALRARMEIPRKPQEFFASMQRLAVYVQTVAYSKLPTQSESHWGRLRRAVLPFLGQAERISFLESSSRNLAQYLVSLSEQSGFVNASRFRSWQHHPLKIVTVELAWRILWPVYQSAKHRPTDQEGLTRLGSDPEMQRAQRLRVGGEIALSTWMRSMTVVFMGLFGWTVMETGELIWMASEKARAIEQEYVEDLTNPHADSKSVAKWRAYQEDMEAEISDGQRLELEWLQEAGDLTPLERARLQSLSQNQR